MSGWRKRQIADKMNDAMFNRILLSLAGSQEIVDQWWLSPNLAFEGKTPAMMLTSDRERVETYIFNQSDGGEH
jgi:hypothetical protein